MKNLRYGLLLITVLVVILLEGGHLLAAWKSNINNLNLLKGQEVVTTSSCSNIWLSGMLAGRRGDRYDQYKASTQALHCSADYLPLVRAVFPADRGLAGLSTQLYPDSSDAWFWLGEVETSFDKLRARQAYLHAVKLSPLFSLAWCRLGFSYEQTGDLEEAARSFLNCCLRGDPGMNGCLGAGRIMEQMGDIPQAIIYYRYSNFDKARDRADELERQINP